MSALRTEGVYGGGVTPPTPTRVVLYGRVGCHLCADARQLVTQVCAQVGVPWSEVDVDDPPLPGRPDLFEMYGERVPVVEVDGVAVGQWRISEVALRAALAAGPAGPVA
jgi:glutaredoxin